MGTFKTPELNISLNTGTILRQPLNGSIVRTIRDSSWPKKRRFKMLFRELNRTDKDSLITIILAARPAGLLSITDMYGSDYSVVVLGDVTIAQDKFYRLQTGCADPGLYNISFDAEGEVS